MRGSVKETLDKLAILGLAFSLAFSGRGLGEETLSPVAPAKEKSESLPQTEGTKTTLEAKLADMVGLDTVVALVNGEAVTLDDLQRESNPILESWVRKVPPELWPRVKERVLSGQLENLIDRKLILIEAKELGARIDESRVREAVMSLRDVKMSFNGDLSKYLVARGITYRQLHEEVEEQLLFRAMVHEKVSPKVRVSPAEIRQYYEKNIDKFTEEAAIHCFAITFLKRDSAEAAAGVLTKAREALDKIKDGAYFPDVAREYSEDPVRAEKGGDWGWITPGTLEKKASEAAFALEEGQHSGVVEGDAATWILWVKEKRDRTVISLSAAWKEIELTIKGQKQEMEIRRWGQRLRLKAAITYPVPLSEILRR